MLYAHEAALSSGGRLAVRGRSIRVDGLGDETSAGTNRPAAARCPCRPIRAASDRVHRPRNIRGPRSAGHLTWDLQDQSERWSLLKKCPPALDESSFAYRYGGFGTHELVLYYELVRELLWSCWDRLDESGKTRPGGNGLELFTVGDFLTSEVPRLERVRDEWLAMPDPECHGRTPRSIIDRERARLPERMSSLEAIVDPDCPCCQMMADMPGPVFWHLDGCNMDDDFAFDISHRTREEWEAEQRAWKSLTNSLDRFLNNRCANPRSNSSRGEYLVRRTHF